MSAREFNFDGLVGPTHNYAGLSYGNVASLRNERAVAHPREAALQGLAKMKALADRGFAQGVLVPHERPDVATLRRLGFAGSDAQVIERCAREAPAILAAVSSAAPMWTANAATVSPAADTADGRVHFTPANLQDRFHRAIEHHTTGRVLAAMFPDEARFAHHPALPAHGNFGDEGAANHTRLCGQHGDPGVELFVYGQSGFNRDAPRPARYPARQTLEASEAVARLHGLDRERTVFALQAPDVIDAGVFHNDVISVGNGPLLFRHERAFHDSALVLAELRDKLAATGVEFIDVCVPEARVSVSDAVESYLFNSQLLSRPDGGMTLVVPEECRQRAAVWAYLQDLEAEDGPVDEVLVFDLKQSMQNGGGPACLRLRVVLDDADLAAMNPRVLMSPGLYGQLCDWVNTHYRDRLDARDLADPCLLDECRTALDALTGILGLGSVYPFQR